MVSSTKNNQAICYGYSFIVSSNYYPLYHLLSNPNDLEATLFNPLYNSQSNTDFFYFVNFEDCICVSSNPFSKELTEETNFKYYLKNQEVAKKSVKRIDFNNDSTDKKIQYFVKECHIKESKEIIKEYDVYILIKNIKESVFITLEFQYTQDIIKSPFNSKLKKMLKEKFTNYSYNMKFNGNITTCNSIIIPASKRVVFEVLSDLSCQHDISDIYEIKMEDGGNIITKKGEVFYSIWKPNGLKIIYKCNAFTFSEDSFIDCELGAEVVESNIIQPFCGYLNTVKYIDKNKSLLICREFFKDSLQRVSFNMHKHSIQSFLTLVKSVCLSKINNCED